MESWGCSCLHHYHGIDVCFISTIFFCLCKSNTIKHLAWTRGNQPLPQSAPPDLRRRLGLPPGSPAPRAAWEFPWKRTARRLEGGALGGFGCVCTPQPGAFNSEEPLQSKVMGEKFLKVESGIKVFLISRSWLNECHHYDIVYEKDKYFQHFLGHKLSTLMFRFVNREQSRHVKLFYMSRMFTASSPARVFPSFHHLITAQTITPYPCLDVSWADTRRWTIYIQRVDWHMTSGSDPFRSSGLLFFCLERATLAAYFLPAWCVSYQAIRSTSVNAAWTKGLL